MNILGFMEKRYIQSGNLVGTHKSVGFWLVYCVWYERLGISVSHAIESLLAVR